ncbi:uncharacterized protein EI90DRAFT_2366551 [Cantharellus anzutake]|uniref:uncharacterized protein n=1 Tax=Cantharellus anzutake TaxID=1750568 RepID=UPI00190472A4|nr:uncharacterized protein EI90DRAFT_2366551 [Cantharellus anzutake]KAF8324192.1 hypothetical protein EI90DRAFT_2366551 [Cantharellus anzutake]
MADKMEDVKYSSPARISDKDLGVIRRASQPFSRASSSLLEFAEADPARWNDLLPNILGALTIGLEKAFFDVVPNNEQTSSTMENFNNVECRGLITDALKQNRWRPLIEYVEVRLRRARDTNSPNLRLIAKLLNKQSESKVCIFSRVLISCQSLLPHTVPLLLVVRLSLSLGTLTNSTGIRETATDHVMPKPSQ